MKQITISLFSCLLLCTLSCKKFLAEKPDKKLQIPTELRDLQAMLDYNNLMNKGCPGIGELAADNYFTTDARYNAIPQPGYRSLYIWGTDIFDLVYTPNSWSKPYAIVYQSNLVLQGLSSIQHDARNAPAWDNLWGSALVYRARALQELLFAWAKAYDKETATEDLGIPLRLTTDFNERSVRENVETSYAQVIADLANAVPYLPAAAAHPLRPSKPAVYTLLARTYLAMRIYDSCWKYADLALQTRNGLVDFNTLNASSTLPFPRFTPEIIMDNTFTPIAPLNPTRAFIDSNLILSYTEDDLRRTVFFTKNADGTYCFKGSYAGENGYYAGETTDELYLMRAECAARAGQTGPAMDDLNALLVTRWKTGSFVPFTATDATDALQKILVERRKELVFRDLRWMDIKRLNKEGAMITLHRFILGKEYTLPPNDNRFALPLPEDVIQLSGMPQNER